MTPDNLKLVLVEWDDAWTDNEPVTQATAHHTHDPYRITTLGWMLVDDAKGITLVNEFYDGAYRGKTFIPRGLVVKVTEHTLTKPRKPKAPKVSA
jgi:hypothetical protein